MRDSPKKINPNWTLTANEFGGPKDIRSRMSKEIELDVPGYTVNEIGDIYGSIRQRRCSMKLQGGHLWIEQSDTYGCF